MLYLCAFDIFIYTCISYYYSAVSMTGEVVSVVIMVAVLKVRSFHVFILEAVSWC